jgi:hypothetical protein
MGSSTSAYVSTGEPCRVAQNPDTKVLYVGKQASGLPPIPKVIWTYWAGSALPALAKACVLSWMHYHPSWQVRVLTPENLTQYLSPTELDMKSIQWVDSRARESDIARINVIAKHGGVWLDATLLLAAPMKFIETIETEGEGPAFAGYYLQQFTLTPCLPVVENWAFAARPGSVFVRKWRDAFMATPNVPSGPSMHLAALRSAGVTGERIPAGAQHYLLMHMVALSVLQNTPADDLSMELHPAELGPFKYLVDTAYGPEGWSSLNGSIQLLRTFHPRRNSAGPVQYESYKMRNRERGFLPPCSQHLLLTRMQYAAMEQP